LSLLSAAARFFGSLSVGMTFLLAESIAGPRAGR
jgi:hypothetical protein